MSKQSVYVLPMTYLDDIHHEFAAIDLVNDAILTLTDPVSTLPGKFLTTSRPWFMTQLLDPLYDSLPVLLSGNGL